MISRRQLLIGAAAGLLPFPAWAARKPKILIIGAGVAGLAAAHALKRKGYSPIVLEARDRIGGRLHTDRTLSAPVDLGASWIHGTKNNPLYDFAIKNKISVALTDDTSLPETFSYTGAKLTLPERSKLYDRFQMIRAALSTRRRGLPAGQDKSVQEAFDYVLKLGKLSAEDDLAMRHYIVTEIENDSATDASNLSLRDYSNRAWFEGGEVLVPGGYDQIPKLLAKGIDVRLQQIVSKIEYGKTGVKVHTQSGVLEADKVLVTLPLGVLKKGSVEFAPPLPPAKAKAIEDAGMGTFTKVFLEFTDRFWSEKITWLEFMGEKPKQWPMFLSLWQASKKPILAAFNVGSFGKSLESSEDEAIVNEALVVLRKCYPTANIKVKGSKITRWASDPFALGAYTYVPVGQTSALLDEIGKPIDNLVYFAGEATNGSSYGTVHAAYNSGLRAAKSL